MRYTLRSFAHFALFAVTLTLAAPAWGSLILETDPSSGSIAVQQNSANGWGFTLSSDDSNYYVLTGVEFCIGAAPPGTGTCNGTLVGFFTDFASAVNGLIIGPAYSPSPYSEAFDNTLQTGLGSFSAFNGTAPQSVAGLLYVYYDLYSGDPGAGGSQLGAGLSVTHAAQVDIVDTSAVPEPRSLLLVALGGTALLLKRRLA